MSHRTSPTAARNRGARVRAAGHGGRAPLDRRRSIASGLVACALIQSVIAIPAVNASPPEDNREPTAPDDGATDPAVTAASALYDLGRARYEASDFGGAVEAWVQAAAALPMDARYRTVRAELNYDIATAQRRWFAIDGDVRHLKMARSTLGRFREDVPSIYPDDEATSERARIDAVLAELDAEIAAADAAEFDRQRSLAEASRPRFDAQADARERKRNRRMIHGGAIATGLGGAGLGLLVTGLVLARTADRALSDLPTEADLDERREVLARGRTANPLWIAGAAIAALGLGVGIPLVVTGSVQERRRKQRTATLTAGPVGVRGGGLIFELRL